MFRSFESLTDPFAPAPDEGVRAAPPDRLWRFLIWQLVPFRRVLAWIALSGLIVALVETGLIYYAGRVVDILATAGPAAFWGRHGAELAGVALLILIARPAVIVLNQTLLNQALAMREGTLGPDHPDVGWSLRDLGLLRLAQDEPAQAAADLARAVAIYREALGPDHPDLSEILPAYAEALQAVGQAARADSARQAAESLPDTQ